LEFGDHHNNEVIMTHFTRGGLHFVMFGPIGFAWFKRRSKGGALRRIKHWLEYEFPRFVLPIG
jgi:hypothetical protein